MNRTRFPSLILLILTALLTSTACSSGSKQAAPAAAAPAAAPVPAPQAEAKAPPNPFATAEAGKQWVVGKGTVGDMNVIYFMEEPKPDMVHSGMQHMKDGTHHFEVKVYDKNAPFDTVPYARLSTVLTHRDSKKQIKTDVKPMLGGWFHYGEDVRLTDKGIWDVVITVKGPDMLRYARVADKFTAEGELKFVFEYK